MKKSQIITVTSITLAILLCASTASAQETVREVLAKTIKAQDKQVSIGKVNQVNTNKVTIQDTQTNTTEEQTIDTTTRVLGENKRALRVKDLKPNDKIAI